MPKAPAVILPDDIKPATMALIEKWGCAGALVSNLMMFVALRRNSLGRAQMKVCDEQIAVCRKALELHEPDLLKILEDMDARAEGMDV